MTTSRYTANHKTWDHVGNLTPLVEHSESPFPHFDGRVAPWLPISGHADNIAQGFIARYDVRDEDYVVVSSGKVVAMDSLGYLLPAGVRENWNTAGAGDTVLRYTAADVTARVMDLGTGTFVTAATSYTKTQLTLQLQQMGWLNVNETLEQFIGMPIGLARYNYWQAAGSDLDNPSSFRYHNYKMQDRVAIICDYVIRLPHVPFSSNSVTTPAFADAFVIANLDDANAAGVWGSLTTYQTQMDRYDVDSNGDALVNADAVGLCLRHAPCAKWTARTALTVTSGATNITDTVLTRSVGSVGAISAAGDYFFDFEVGILWLYEAGANALPTGWTIADVVAFSDYTDVPATVGTYACVVGEIQPGDFLVCDGNSNLAAYADLTTAEVDAIITTTAATSAEVATLLATLTAKNDLVLGQVLSFKAHPVDALERVRTAYSFLGTQDQMPGSASQGYPDTVTYASAADREVVINLIGR